MLSGLHSALSEHLVQLDAPLFQEGCVPQGKAFPYIVMSLDAQPTPDTPGVLSLTVWCAGNAAHPRRLAMAEDLLTLIPARGIRLDTLQGCAVLFAGYTTAQCVGSGKCLGAQLTWKLHCFPAE